MEEQSSMANSGTISNQSRKKKQKMRLGSPSRASADGRSRWRTESEQQIYSSKLVNELLRLRRPGSASATSRTVRGAADRVLAVSAKGRTRWSRAILAGRLARTNKKHRKAARPSAGAKKPASEKKPPPLQRKLRVLSRLVPGCQKLPLPNLLEETTDYIAALEMQVKAMTFLTALLNDAVSVVGDGDGDGGGLVVDRGQYRHSS